MVLQRFLGIVLLVGLAAPPVFSQEKLAHMIPLLFGHDGLVLSSELEELHGRPHHAHFDSSFRSNFLPFNTAFASQVALVAAPSVAAGFSYSFDPSLGVFSKINDSYGPLMTERAETIGRHKATLGFSFQRFTYDALDGVPLTSIPVVFVHDEAAPGPTADVVTTTNTFRSEFSQFTAFLNYGLTDNIDVTAALPVVDVTLSARSRVQIQRIGSAGNLETHFFEHGDAGMPGSQDHATFAKTGSATGLGDISLRVKHMGLDLGASRVAWGLEMRLPTGDEEDLLGSGALGIKPFAAWSSSGSRVSPHAKLAYEWNGRSVLAGDVMMNEKRDLPDQIYLEAGADFAVSKKLTLAADVLARRVMGGNRLEMVDFHPLDEHAKEQHMFPNSAFTKGDFNVFDVGIGFKANPIGRVLVDCGIRLKLNNRGLRDRVMPLLALEYGF